MKVIGVIILIALIIGLTVLTSFEIVALVKVIKNRKKKEVEKKGE